MFFQNKSALFRQQSVLLSFIFLIICINPVSGLAASLDDYRLGAGDKIRIQVFGEDDLTVETLVGEAGTLSYPFLGEITVKGQTLSGLEKFIAGKLKGPYLVDPEVTVSILEYRQFYVNGHVQKPGGFPFQPGMTVRKAISLAGGFEERANKEKVFVVHGDDPNGVQIPVKLEALVQPGDIVTVDRSFF
ncbi:MAG: capsular biosynthesis protein [Sedimenticola sp.]|nr:MAG: capsular biosynthesis protein [Sedimenticola sp.]